MASATSPTLTASESPITIFPTMPTVSWGVQKNLKPPAAAVSGVNRAPRKDIWVVELTANSTEERSPVALAQISMCFVPALSRMLNV